MFLVTGANGQLGNELKLLLQDKAVYVDRAELDITDAEAVQAYAAKQKWEAIINCAAYTAVDKAESDAETAEKINVLGPENLAKTGIPLIQISTDYVFDGRNWPANRLFCKMRQRRLLFVRPGCIRLSAIIL